MSGFSQELEEERAYLLRYARYLVLGNRVSPEDLVQETFYLALKLKDSFQPGTNLRAWLFAIMRNEYRNELRKVRRRTALFIDGLDFDVEDFGVEIGAGTEQETSAALSETMAAVKRLPGRYREVLILVTIKGLSYSETAALLGKPVGTVRSRLSRARVKLVDEVMKK
ncbi:MAG: RNA polymerase sigma factor [Pseudomonadota bacterium]